MAVTISSNVATALEQQVGASSFAVALVAQMLQRGAAQIVDLSEKDDLAEEPYGFPGKRPCRRDKSKLLFKPVSFQDK